MTSGEDGDGTLPSNKLEGQQCLGPAEGSEHSQFSIRRARVEVWQAPLPPPTIVAQYNDIIPNGADRIMILAERALAAEIDDNRRGPLLGAALSALAMLCALASIPLGAPWELSAAFIGIPTFAIIKALIDSGTRRNKKE